MWGVVKGFHIACNFTGPLGDLTGSVTSQVRKWFSERGPEKFWKRSRDMQHGQEQTEKGTKGCSVWSIDGPPGDLTGTDVQPSGKVVLESGAGHAKETTNTKSEQTEKDSLGCSVWSIGYR